MPEKKQTFGCYLPEFTIAFPTVFEAKAYAARPGQEGKGEKSFSYTAMWPTDADLTEVKRTAMAAAKAAWPGLEEIGKNVRFPFKSGDREADRLVAAGKAEDAVKPYRGKVILKAKTGEKYPPEVLVKRGATVENMQNPRDMYSGCKCMSMVMFRASEVKGEKFVSAYFNDVIKVGDGERIFGRDAKSAYRQLLGGSSAADPTGDDDIAF